MLKKRLWNPSEDLYKPLHYTKGACFLFSLEENEASRDLIYAIFAIIALSSQHLFVATVPFSLFCKMEEIKEERVSPKTAPGAQTGHTEVDQFTNEYMNSAEYEILNRAPEIAWDSAMDKRSLTSNQRIKLYHQLISPLFKDGPFFNNLMLNLKTERGEPL